MKVFHYETLIYFTMGEPRPYKEGSVIKFNSLPKVYMVTATNILRWITTESIFSKLGYSFQDLSQVSDAFWFLYKRGGDIMESNYQEIK